MINETKLNFHPSLYSQFCKLCSPNSEVYPITAGTVSNGAGASLSFSIWNVNTHTLCRKHVFQGSTEPKVALVLQYFNKQILSEFRNETTKTILPI